MLGVIGRAHKQEEITLHFNSQTGPHSSTNQHTFLNVHCSKGWLRQRKPTKSWISDVEIAHNWVGRCLKYLKYLLYIIINEQITLYYILYDNTL